VTKVIQFKRSSTPGHVPAALANGELGINVVDKKLYSSDGTTVFAISSGEANTITVGANNTQNGVQSSFSQVTTTGTSTQNVDSWAVASWSMAAYTIRIKDNVANNVQSCMINALWNGGGLDTTVFGVIYSNTYLGTFASTSNATHGVLQFTPTSANTTLSISRTLLTA